MTIGSCAVKPTDPHINSVEFTAHAVFAYGSGRPSTGFIFSEDMYTKFAIPELLVYDNGLVLFACPEKEWPKICQSSVSLERLSCLFDDLKAAGFFEANLVYPSGVGPNHRYFIFVQMEDISGTAEWASNSFGPYPPPNPLQSTLEIIDTFKEEVQVSRLIYEPSDVALWILGCQCTSESVEQTGGLCNICDDSESFPEWPFEFEPPDETLAAFGWMEALELPQPISAIEASIPNLPEQSWQWSDNIFRHGDTLLSIHPRPYLPGETIQTSYAKDRWDGQSPVYDTLPFYVQRQQ